MHSENLSFTFPFQKINEEKRIVTGIATADNPDLVDDVVNFDASVEAFSNWIGNIREMHSPVAVGKLVDWKPVPVVFEGETYQGIEVSVYISKGAENTWQKILDGTLRGFSIGGNVVRAEKKKSEKLGRYINEIVNYKLGELSVVDNPCNPAGMFAMIKSIDGQLEYVAEDMQDVYYCEEDAYASIGGDSVCVYCEEEMLVIGKSQEYDEIIVNKLYEAIIDSFQKALSDINTVPTDAMAAEARRGLEWRKEFNRGGTPVGVARARDIMNKDTLSISTVRRMHSFFSRHEVDKQGKGFTPGDGYPSAGRIAWALWGGDPGQTWARAITNRIKAMEKGVGTDVHGMSVDGPSEIVSDINKAPAPPSDRIRGSESNEPGSASGRSGGIEVSSATEQTLRNKVKEHNDKMSEGRPEWTRVTLGQLKAVYRRGAGAFSTSHRPGMNRNQWAIARVNAFLYLSRTGRPENAKYITDYDLLDSDHPKSSKSKMAYLDVNESMEKAEEDDYMCSYCDDSSQLAKDMSCPECDGEGEMPDGSECEYCEGDGVIMKGSYCVYCKAIGTGEIGAGGGGIKKPQQGIYDDDEMNKAVTKREDGEDFPAAAFAYVPDSEKPSTWKLRLWDSISQKETVAQVSRAATALTSAGFRGNQVDIPSEDLPKVKEKIRAAWRRVNGPDRELPTVLKEMEVNIENNINKIIPMQNGMDLQIIYSLRKSVSDNVYENEDIGEEVMVSNDNDDLQLTKNYDTINDMSQEDFTDTQKETILSKLGSFLFGKETVEKAQVVDVNNMNHSLRIVSEGDMSQAPRIVVNVGGGMLEESVGSDTPKMEVINTTSSENIVGGDASLTGPGTGEFAPQSVKKSEDGEDAPLDGEAPEGEEEMDFEKVLDGISALLDEKLEKVKADITAEVDGKIDAIEKSVSEVKDSAEELSSDLEKVANSGAEKKSVDVDADDIADGEALEKSVESESFWGGMFVPAEIVKVLGYNS
jgi:hypothetical protein